MHIVLLGLIVLATSSAAPLPRNVRVSGQQFVITATRKPIVMAGPNVVVKGPPYMPSTTGTTICNDITTATCAATGTCTSCETFNQVDVDNLKALGWNAIRLGVVWAGAQPRDEDALDSGFVQRLDALLNLTDANGIHVILDNHGDMVSSAGCGNGVPMWIAQLAAPQLIGKQLVTDFPYSLFIPVSGVGGYSLCAGNATAWQEHAGDPNYNILNRCCLAMNSGNPGGLGFSTINQAIMDYVFTEGAGRTAFVRFWTLMAQAVTQHPSAFAAELMNEPMSIKRNLLFDTWMACQMAINAVIPDMSVSIADVGEGAIIPAWVDQILGPGIDISPQAVAWIKATSTLYYAWHYYGADGGTPNDAIQNVRALMMDWNVTSFATEMGSCDTWNAAVAAGISHSYWHYSSYCTTGPSFGNRTVPTNTFGACILGWGGGHSNGLC